MEWSKQFEIIKKEISRMLEFEGKKWSDQAAADALGLNIGKIRAWKKGQRPAAEDLEVLSRELGFSAEWLLLGKGTPKGDSQSANLIPEYVHIGDTLKELVSQLPATHSEIARAGGVGNDELTSFMLCHSLPSCLTISQWVHKYKINANFLIAQVGQPFLTEEEYNRDGPLDWVRGPRGDFSDKEPNCESVPPEEMNERLTSIQREMLTYKRIMLEINASSEKIANGLEAIATGRSNNTKSTYATAEPPASCGYNKIHEPSGGFDD
jgi:hypothetical protein